MEKYQKHFADYWKLRDEADREFERLYSLHAGHMQCRKGCDACCMEFRVFPVEYYAIKQQAESCISRGQRPDRAQDCPFLVNHNCVIYDARPIICRTQGLPLLFMGDENWELSVCELNFTRFEDADFSPENTFSLDAFNSRLYLINRSFIQDMEDQSFKETDLLSMRSLFQDYG